jgi:hypothetical protein
MGDLELFALPRSVSAQIRQRRRTTKGLPRASQGFGQRERQAMSVTVRYGGVTRYNLCSCRLQLQLLPHAECLSHAECGAARSKKERERRSHRVTRDVSRRSYCDLVAITRRSLDQLVRLSRRLNTAVDSLSCISAHPRRAGSRRSSIPKCATKF